MRTACASGAAAGGDAADAIRRALDQALSRLDGRTVRLGLIFASPRHSLAQALASARARVPGADFVGCTTAGELTEQGVSSGAMAVMLVAWGAASHSVSIAKPGAKDAAALQQTLCVPAPGSAPRPAAPDARHSTCVLLGDGLSPMFEKLVVAIRKSAAGEYRVVGGGAGDDGAFSATEVGVNDTAVPGAMAAVHVQSKSPWGVGVAHGLRPATPAMTVTAATGNLVSMLDERPAVEVYREYARARGLTFDEAHASQFLVENELGVMLFDDVVRVRAPLRVEAGGALWFAGEVPEGSTVSIVRGEHAEVVAAARDAAAEAKAGLAGAKPAGVLVFSCVCRKLVLGARHAEEVDAIKSVFPGVPLAGFSSYGEIARTASKLDGYHNNTIVVAAIPE